MILQTVVLVGVMLLVCPTGRTQTKSLGDVAGSIKLNPEAIVEKNGVVVDSGAGDETDGELLGGVLAGCSAVADQLGELVEQARNTTLLRDDPILARMEESARELEREVQEIYLLRLGDGFSEPLGEALEAADICGAAGATVREDINLNNSTFTKSNAEIVRCRRQMGQARERFAAVVKTPGRFTSASTTKSSPETPPTDDEIIAARCGSERSKGPDAVDACRQRQYLSQAAMASRNADNEMLDPGVFADIRRVCLKLYPRDFVGQDNCEQSRMTESRLENE